MVTEEEVTEKYNINDFLAIYSLYYKIIGGKQMKKVSKQMSMEISGGHTVVAYPRNGPDNEYEASKPGVAGWVRKCPAKGHTTCHEYSGLTYDPKYGGNGRVYVCRSKGCN